MALSNQHLIDLLVCFAYLFVLIDLLNSFSNLFLLIHFFLHLFVLLNESLEGHDFYSFSGQVKGGKRLYCSF